MTLAVLKVGLAQNLVPWPWCHCKIFPPEKGPNGRVPNGAIQSWSNENFRMFGWKDGPVFVEQCPAGYGSFLTSLQSAFVAKICVAERSDVHSTHMK